MSAKTTYWVRSKQANEINGFGRRPVPAQFKKLEEAKEYQRQLNLRRGSLSSGLLHRRTEYSPDFVLASKKQDHWVLMTGVSGATMSFAITSRMVSGVVVLDLSGRLCFLETSLRDNVNELLEEGHRWFVLNLEHVPYIDSFGLGQLISIWTAINSKGGRLILLRPTDQVQHLFQISKLNTIFHVSGEESQAVRHAHTNVRASA